MNETLISLFKISCCSYTLSIIDDVDNTEEKITYT